MKRSKLAADSMTIHPCRSAARHRLVLAALLLLAGGACSAEKASSYRASAVANEEAAQLLLNRNWMDVLPESANEKLHVFRFVPSMGGGVYQDRTMFKGSFELFSFKVREDKIHFHLHHEKERKVVGFRIERVDGPKPFDLKLTLDRSPRGPGVYFGRSSETSTTLDFQPLP